MEIRTDRVGVLIDQLSSSKEFSEQRLDGLVGQHLGQLRVPEPVDRELSDAGHCAGQHVERAQSFQSAQALEATQPLEPFQAANVPATFVTTRTM